MTFAYYCGFCHCSHTYVAHLTQAIPDGDKFHVPSYVYGRVCSPHWVYKVMTKEEYERACKAEGIRPKTEVF